MRAQEVKIKWGGGVNITLYTVNKMYRKLKFISSLKTFFYILYRSMIV